MLLVILGAGASYDSTPRFTPGMGVTANGINWEPRPPLADDLFSSRFSKTMDIFSEVKPLVPRLRTSVEERLQEFQEQAKHYPERYYQLMSIRHYVSRVVGGCEETWLDRFSRITNHIGLLDAIRYWCLRNRERVCFVTFNYDTFIEEAFRDSTLNIRIRELDDFISDDAYKVIKLHGSTTWFHEVASPSKAEPGKEKAFLRMLGNLPPNALGVVVGENEDNAREIIRGLPGNADYLPSTAKGFSRFIEDGLAERFLFGQS